MKYMSSIGWNYYQNQALRKEIIGTNGELRKTRCGNLLNQSGGSTKYIKQ